MFDNVRNMSLPPTLFFSFKLLPNGIFGGTSSNINKIYKKHRLDNFSIAQHGSICHAFPILFVFETSS